MKTMKDPWIKLREHLNHDDYDLIRSLQTKCENTDKISLKLELDYKLATAQQRDKNSGMKAVNEFMYFDENHLIGYIGICSFGGEGMPFEITGMVDPEYRQQGVFTKLNELALAECKRRKPSDILILCDKKSTSGQRFVKKIGAVYKNSEYEMYLQENYPEPKENLLCGITLRKAMNSDAYEVARQNAIFFDDNVPSENSDLLLPEEEEKRGMIIYLAEIDKQIIGKVHLETNTEVSGIYGLGVLPEYRGKGLGRALLRKAIEKLKEENVKKIMLQVATKNATALNLYQSCGFNITSTMDYFEMTI